MLSGPYVPMLRLNIRAGSILDRTEKKATVELTEDRQWTCLPDHLDIVLAVAGAVAGGKPRTDWILRVWSEAGKNQCSVVTGL